MTPEEKAKAYDEAYKVAESIHKFSSNPAEIKRMEEIFPDLKESEDERIRGAIIDHLKDNNLTEWAVWLEKQGEQKSKKASIWKHWKDGIAGNGEGKPIYLVKVYNTYSLTSCLGFECDYIELSELDSLMFKKQGEQNPAWSEEDENVLEDIEEAIINYWHGDTQDILLDWLKFLKDRVQPQPKPKQEWSEEDEEFLSEIISDIKFAQDKHPDSQMNQIIFDEEVTWLKSLKDRVLPQNTWKPSDEQLDALHDAAVYVDKSMFPYPKGILMKLYKQLKKLREE